MLLKLVVTDDKLMIFDIEGHSKPKDYHKVVTVLKACSVVLEPDCYFRMTWYFCE